MANLGRMIGTSPQHVILRTNSGFKKNTLPKIGETVYDLEQKKVGKIADIFGPVKKPFISIKVGAKHTLDDFEERKGQSFYTFQKATQKRKGRTPRNKRYYHKRNSRS